MKRFALILTAVLVSFGLRAADYERLEKLLGQFYETLVPETVEAKTAEFNSLISSCMDSLTRQKVALSVFDHYKESPVMGEEEVAINIYDRWFASGEIKMRSDFDKMDAELFVNFNRSTLLGSEAPEVSLLKPCGRKKVTVPEDGKCAVLYFYDTSCAKCRAELEVLPAVLKEIDFPANFYAVFCGSDKNAWKKARKSLKFKNIDVYHLWDPEIESDYLKLYGVISTPRLYLTEPGGLIIGRRLEPESLAQLLPTARSISKAYEETKQN